MALINCTECGKEISDTSKKCIHCGFENTPKRKSSKKVVWIIIGFISIAIIILFIYIFANGVSLEKKALNEIEKEVSDSNIDIINAYYNEEKNYIFILFNSSKYKNDKVLIKFDSKNNIVDTYYEHIFDAISKTDYENIIKYEDFVVINFRLSSSGLDDSWEKID